MYETEIKIGQTYAWKDDQHANGMQGAQFKITGADEMGLRTYQYVTHLDTYNNSVIFTATDETILLGATLIEDVKSEFYKGLKVRITGDTISHGFPTGTEVYLLGDDGGERDTWLASEDRNAEPRWTGRMFASNLSTVVMNVAEADMEIILEEPLAQPQWSEVKVGSKVTIKYIPTGEEFTTTAHEGEYGDLAVLGWAIYTNEAADAPEDMELLSVEKPQPVLPTTNGSIVRRAKGYGQPEAHLIAGSWTMANSGHTNVLPDTWVDGWVLVRDAGSDD